MRLPKLGKDGRYKLEAKTAYGLLSTIIAIVKNDARTMQMQHWGGAPGNASYIAPERTPQCGTVGCIGGWTEHLAQTSNNGGAARVLGFERDEATARLFFYGDLCDDDNQGTPSHARKVIRHIQRFQRKYRVRLMAKKVVPYAR